MVISWNIKGENLEGKANMIDSNSIVNEEGLPNPNDQPHTAEKAANNGEKENQKTFLTGGQLRREKRKSVCE